MLLDTSSILSCSICPTSFLTVFFSKLEVYRRVTVPPLAMKKSKLPRAISSVPMRHKPAVHSSVDSHKKLLHLDSTMELGCRGRSGKPRSTFVSQPPPGQVPLVVADCAIKADQSMGKSLLPKMKELNESRQISETLRKPVTLQPVVVKPEGQFLSTPLDTMPFMTASSSSQSNVEISLNEETSYEDLLRALINNKKMTSSLDPTGSSKQCCTMKEPFSGLSSSCSRYPYEGDVLQHSIRPPLHISKVDKDTPLGLDPPKLPHDVTNRFRSEETKATLSAILQGGNVDPWHARHEAAASKSQEYAMKRLKLEPRLSYVGGVQAQQPCIGGSLLHRLECGHLICTTGIERCAKNCQASTVSASRATTPEETFSCSLCIAKLVEDDISERKTQLAKGGLKGVQLCTEEMLIRAEALDKGDRMRVRGRLCFAVLRSEDISVGRQMGS